MEQKGSAASAEGTSVCKLLLLSLKDYFQGKAVHISIEDQVSARVA